MRHVTVWGKCGGLLLAGSFLGWTTRSASDQWESSRYVYANSSFRRQSGPLAEPTSDVEFQSDFTLPFRPHPHSHLAF